MKGDRYGFGEYCRKAGSITFIIWRTAVLIGILGLFCVSGCAGSKKTNFFVLFPLSAPSATSGSWNSNTSVGVGPVTIPEYLNRPQIVTRPGKNEVSLAEFNRWAESLEVSIPRVIAENLSTLLDTDRVYTFPWRGSPPEYQIRIEILQFDGNTSGNIELLARLTLLKDGTATRINRHKFYIKKPIAGQGYEGMVSAMSLVLSDMSRYIAGEMMSDPSDNGSLGTKKTP